MDQAIPAGRTAAVPPDRQEPLLEAVVTGVDPDQGRMATIRVAQGQGSHLPGRVLSRDFRLEPCDDLWEVLKRGDQLLVRRLRRRPSGEWDFCVPNVWSEPTELWVPDPERLVSAPIVRVGQEAAEGLLPGGIAVTIPRACLRARTVREKCEELGRPVLGDHLRPDRLLKAGSTVTGYIVERREASRTLVMCPRWARDNAFSEGHLERTYRPGRTYPGVVAWVRVPNVFVLLEPGIEACLPASVLTARGLSEDDLTGLLGTRVTVTVERIDPRFQSVRLCELESMGRSSS